MKEYVHRVHYHETDKMGITHHSNYIKWMEEARIFFLEELGFNYAYLEEQGIVSPVINVECRYQQPTTFDDEVSIHTEVLEYNGVKLKIGYTMTNLKTGVPVAEATSMHCFTNDQGRPIILKKKHPEFDEVLKCALNKAE